MPSWPLEILISIDLVILNNSFLSVQKTAFISSLQGKCLLCNLFEWNYNDVSESNDEKCSLMVSGVMLLASFRDVKLRILLKVFS